MSELLLDTHAFIWFVSNDVNLPESTRDLIETAETVFLSIASLWEIAIKISLGKLTLKGALEDIECQLSLYKLCVSKIIDTMMTLPKQLQKKFCIILS